MKFCPELEIYLKENEVSNMDELINLQVGLQWEIQTLCKVDFNASWGKTREIMMCLYLVDQSISWNFTWKISGQKLKLPMRKIRDTTVIYMLTSLQSEQLLWTERSCIQRQLRVIETKSHQTSFRTLIGLTSNIYRHLSLEHEDGINVDTS